VTLQQLHVAEVTEVGTTSVSGGIHMVAAARLLLFVKASGVCFVDSDISNASGTA
jgi:hypothetical protein